MLPVKSEMPGNAPSRELLNKWQAAADGGSLSAIAIVAYDTDRGLVCDYAGSINHEFQIYFGLTMLQDGIKLGIKDRNPLQEGEDAEKPPANLVYCNLATFPHSFDFLTWLIDAEMTRVREGAPAPLKVYFRGASSAPSNSSKQMLYNVMKPMVSLVGGVEDGIAASGRSSLCATCRPISDAARRGEEVPRLKPSTAAQRRMSPYKGVVTITLREATHWPHRNSNLDEWKKLVDHISGQGERVLIVRDTSAYDVQQDENGKDIEYVPLWPEYEECREASLDVDLRHALTEGAKANLYVGNGPCQMALFGTAPFLTFVKMDENDRFEANRPGWWKDKMGIEVGEQYPWSSPLQRFIWTTDDFEPMRDAWDDLQAAIPTTVSAAA
jgi:hypothetical protein